MANTKQIALPPELVDVVWSRINIFLEKYHNDQKITSSTFKHPIKAMGLKELCVSCYQQGLMDGNQLPKVISVS